MEGNKQTTSLSAESFEELRTQLQPVCLRDGTAISALSSRRLTPSQIRVKSGTLQQSQRDAADDLRSGLCNGFIQPFWMAQDMLISAANAQCDLSASPPGGPARPHPAAAPWRPAVAVAALARARSPDPHPLRLATAVASRALPSRSPSQGCCIRPSALPRGGT